MNEVCSLLSLLLDSSVLLGGFLNDTDSNGLLHVSNGESTERRELREGLNNHRLGGDHLDDGGITGLDVLGELFSDLTSSLVHLGLNFGELASNMAGVAIEDGRVTILDLTGMVHDDDLSLEELGIKSGGVLGVGSDVTSLDILDGDVLNVETKLSPGMASSTCS
jgi:hypothetical protein